VTKERTVLPEIERVGFTTYRGKQILVVDLSYCSPSEVEEILRVVPNHVTTQPLHSVRILADFTQASFNSEVVRVMKESAIFDKAYIKKTAWIGTESFPESYREEVSKFSGRQFPVFGSRAEAMEWLTKD
jgi:hypothetical protein